MIQFPCVCCRKSVKTNQRGLLCPECSEWTHSKCANISNSSYDSPNEHFIGWRCQKCVLKELPFYGSDIIENECINAQNVCDQPILPEPIVCSSEYLKFPSQRGLKLSHLNIRSLNNKKDNLESFLKKCPYDIFSLSETWLNDNISSNLVSIPNYNFERKDRTSHGGGVGCYILKSLHYVRRFDLENDNLECMWIELKQINHAPYFIGIYYRKPDANLLSLNLFEDQIHEVSTISNNLIIMGDFNCNMLTENNLSNKVNEMCGLFSMSQLIQSPTRITPNSRSLIDLVIVSNCLGSLISGVQSVGLSDHSLVYVILKSQKAKAVPVISRFRSFRNFNEQLFLDDLRNVSWDITDRDNVDLYWDNFKNNFNRICDKHAPIVSVRRKVKGAPWITEEYLQISRERDYNKRKFDITNDIKYWNAFKKYRNQSNTLNKKLKKKYYETVNKAGNGIKMT